jgi:hypothetical protein
VVLPSSRAGRDTVPVVHWASVLVPYLAGAASTFAAQYLIRVLVDPRVEGRRRGDERWEATVLDLGELLSGPVSRAAQEALASHLLLRAMRDFPVPTMGPDPGRERREQATWEQMLKARQPHRACFAGTPQRRATGFDRSYRQNAR